MKHHMAMHEGTITLKDNDGAVVFGEDYTVTMIAPKMEPGQPTVFRGDSPVFFTMAVAFLFSESCEDILDMLMTRYCHELDTFAVRQSVN